MKRLVIFGSGSGSNAENICVYFKNSSSVKIAAIYTNNKNAFIVQRAKKLHIPLVLITKTDLNEFSGLQKTLLEYQADYLILAGFLLKIPSKITAFYSKKIINIHPSLLPKYGGRGMYGDNVHKAVLKSGDTETGITIHFVNENYDEGEIITQKKCLVCANETVSSLKEKIRTLELEHFPRSIEKIILR